MKYGKYFVVWLCLLGLLMAFPLCVSADETTAPATEFDGTDNSSDSNDIVPVALSSDSFEGVPSFTLITNLGSITLQLPYGTDVSSVQFRGNRLYNLNSSTLYFFCPEFPDYTFSASRFGPVSYRVSGYDTSELEVQDVQTSIQSWDVIRDYVMTFLLVLVVFLLIRGVMHDRTS